MYSIWTERYRPKSYEDIVGQDEIVDRVKAFTESMQIPHLLFAGPAGSGKSTLALIVAKEAFGEGWKQNFLELNASDTRGIDIVRSKIKDFARTKAIGNVPYKIIFLDEADSLTSEAQNALRRTMENYSKSCRFFLSCNYSNKIIEPIQSRCAVFRFRGITSEDIKKRLDYIIKIEKIKIEPNALDAISNLANGDMRKAINLLQTSAINIKKITEKAVYSVAAKAQPKDVGKMLEFALNGKFEDARKILLDLILKQGIAGEDIIKQMNSQTYKLEIADGKKMKLIEKIGEFEFRLNMGGNAQIQLESFLAQLALVK